MNGEVLYTTRWNDWTRQPMPGHSYLDEAAARALWDRGELLLVVDGSRRGPAGEVQARWLFSALKGDGARCVFYTPAGSVWRRVDYRLIDGRLWRWIVTDWQYPDDDRLYSDSKALFRIKGRLDVDGTGYVDFFDEKVGKGNITKFRDYPFPAGYWMDPPQFGDWSRLADPDNGTDGQDFRMPGALIPQG
jgi:hypothetical protein